MVSRFYQDEILAFAPSARHVSDGFRRMVSTRHVADGVRRHGLRLSRLGPFPPSRFPLVTSQTAFAVTASKVPCERWGVHV